jgi:hypothetical protein
MPLRASLASGFALCGRSALQTSLWTSWLPVEIQEAPGDPDGAGPFVSRSKEGIPMNEDRAGRRARTAGQAAA